MSKLYRKTAVVLLSTAMLATGVTASTSNSLPEVQNYLQYTIDMGYGANSDTVLGKETGTKPVDKDSEYTSSTTDKDNNGSGDKDNNIDSGKTNNTDNKDKSTGDKSTDTEDDFVGSAGDNFNEQGVTSNGNKPSNTDKNSTTDKNTTANINTVNKPDNSIEYTDDNLVANTLHLDVVYSGGAKYFPTVSMTIKNKRTGVSVPVFVANDTGSYNPVKSAVSVKVNNFEYKNKDILEITVKELDDILLDVFTTDKQETLKLPKGKTTALQIDAIRAVNSKEKAVLEGTLESPLTVYTTYKDDTFIYNVTTPDGKPLPDTDVVIIVGGNNKDKIETTTDINGNIVLDKNKIKPSFTIKVPNYGGAEVELPPNAFTDEKIDYIHEESIVIKPDRGSNVGNTGGNTSGKDTNGKDTNQAGLKTQTYKVKQTTDFDTRLSTKWMTSIIEYGDKKTKKVSKKTSEIKLPKEAKVKNVTSKTAKVVNHSVKGTDITVKLEPLHTFTLHNNGEEYDVTFINKNNLNIKGKDKIVFALAPNEVIQIKDNKSGRTYSYVGGKETDGKTVSNSELIVSKGKDGSKKDGGKYTNPHTNDIINILIIVTIVGILIILGLLVLRRKLKAISYLVILTLLGSQFIPYGTTEVSADANVGGGDSNTNAGSALSGKMLQMVEYIAGYEVYFVTTDIPNTGINKENFYIEDDGKKRFSRSNRVSAFYFTPDQLTYKALTYQGSGVIEYNDNIGSHQTASVVHNLRVIRGTNTLKTYLGSDLVKDAMSSTHSQLMKHVIEPKYATKGVEATGEGAYFINTMGGIMKEAYNRTNSSVLAPISGSYRDETPTELVDVFGEAASKQFNKLISDESKPETKVNRERLVKSYLELVKKRGIVSNYSDFESSTLKAMSDGKLAIQVNTIVGITQYNSQNNKPHGAKPYAFMSVQDATKWYYYQMRMLRPPANVGTINTLHEKRTADVGLPADSSLYWKWGRIGFTFRQYLRNAYVVTAQPKGRDGKYPVLGSPTGDEAILSKNPYGGWFFQLLGEVDGGKPLLYVTAEIEDKETGYQYPVKLSEWARGANVDLGTLINAKINVNSKYKIGSNIYNVDSNAKVTITSADEVWSNGAKQDFTKVKPTKTKESLLEKRDLSNLVGGKESIEANLSGNSIVLDNHFTTYSRLAKYLGGMAQETHTTGIAPIVNKYYNTKIGNNKAVADLHVHLVIEADKVEKEATKFDYTVPQWSLAEVEYKDFTDDKFLTVFDIDNIGEIYPNTSNVGDWIFEQNLYPMSFSTSMKASGKLGSIGINGSIPFYLDYNEPLVDEGLSWYQPTLVYDSDKINSTDIVYNNEENVTSQHSTPSNTRSNGGSSGYISEYAELNNMVYETPVKTKIRLIRSYLDLELSDFSNFYDKNLGGNNEGSLAGADSIYKAIFVDSNYDYFYNPSEYVPSNDIVAKEEIIKTGTLSRGNSVLVDKWAKRRGESYDKIEISQRLTHTNSYYKYVDVVCGYNSYYGYAYYCPERKTTSMGVSVPSEGVKTDTLGHLSKYLTTTFKVTYDKHLAKTQTKETKQHNELESSGKYSQWLLVNDERKFKFYPEVVMYNELDYDLDTDEYEYSVDIVLGEKERKLNTHFFVKADIVPKDNTGTLHVKSNINGSSATDAQAQALAQGLNTVQNTPVLPKGSSTVNSVGLENSELDLRFYLLDIKDNIVKDKFNPNSSTWDTADEIVNKYLDTMKNDKGEIKGTARGYYYLGDSEYEPVLKDIGYRQVSEPEVIEYELEVRGGELTKVNGLDLDGLREKIENKYGQDTTDICKNDKVYERDSDLSAVCSMTILNMFDDSQGLFSILNSKDGNKIGSEWKDYIDSANALRGLDSDHNKALKVNKEWYYEDTTVFVLREYHYKYSIPTYMWTAKLPMEFSNLDISTPVDKTEFYSKGALGYLGTEFKFGDPKVFEMVFNVNAKDIQENDYELLVNDKEHQFIVPNVSILDAVR